MSYFYFITKGDAIEIKLQAPAKIQDVYQQPSNLKKWLTGTIKGAFYLNDKSDHIISNSYVLELREDSKVFFEIEPYVTEMHKCNAFAILNEIK